MSDHVLSPTQAVEAVVNYLNNQAAGAPTVHPALPTAPSATAAAAASTALVPVGVPAAAAAAAPPQAVAVATVFSVSCDNGVWSITGIDTVSGEEAGSATLPPTATGFFQVVYVSGEAYVWDGSPGGQMTHCADYIASQAHANAALPPGVSAGSALLPGMPGAAAMSTCYFVAVVTEILE